MSPRSAHARFHCLNRFLIEVAGIKMRKDAPFSAMRMDALDNKLKESQDDGEILGERVCLSASDHKLLCDRARWKADAKRHLRDYCWPHFYLLATVGERRCEGQEAPTSRKNVWIAQCVASARRRLEKVIRSKVVA